jgi:cytochrome d ubiquinol oxidase subunit I
MIPSGFIAILAGWVTTEVGRQPWIVYGILRTQDAASPAVTTGAVATSLIVFIVVYAIIFPAGAYYIYRLVSRGPTQARKPRSGARRPKRPLSASDEPYDPNPDSPLEPAKGGR